MLRGKIPGGPQNPSRKFVKKKINIVFVLTNQNHSSVVQPKLRHYELFVLQ